MMRFFTQPSYRFTQKLDEYRNDFNVTVFGTKMNLAMLQDQGADNLLLLRDEAHKKRKTYDHFATNLTVWGMIGTFAMGITHGEDAAWFSGAVLATSLVPLIVKATTQDNRARRLDLAYAVVAQDLTKILYSETEEKLLDRKIIEKAPKPHMFERVKWYTPPL